MANNEVHAINITISTRLARVWVRVMRVCSLVVGRERAERWAVAGAWRMVRYRVGSGRWCKCAPQDAPPATESP